MERDYKYEPALFCEGCGALGGYDLMGDILCEQCMSSMGVPFVEDDTEPVYATLHFYFDDPYSMFRFKMCNQAQSVRNVLFDFDEWLRSQVKYAEREDSDTLQEVRDKLWELFDDEGIDLWEDV